MSATASAPLQERPTPVGVATPAPWTATVRAVVRRGWSEQRRAVLTWGGSLGAYGAFMAAIYPSVRTAITQVTKSYPSGLLQAFRVSDMGTVEGYLQAELFSLIIPLAMGFFAARSVMRPLVGAEESGQLDTLLSLPLSRRVLVTGAFVVTGLLSAAILVLTGALTLVAGQLAGTGLSPGLTMAASLGLWPLSMFFAGVAVLASGVLHRSTSVMGVAVGALVAMYALDLAARLTSALEPVRFVSVFHYYGAPLIDGVDAAGSAGVIAVAVVLTAAGAVLFERRDLRH